MKRIVAAWVLGMAGLIVAEPAEVVLPENSSVEVAADDAEVLQAEKQRAAEALERETLERAAQLRLEQEQDQLKKQPVKPALSKPGTPKKPRGIRFAEPEQEPSQPPLTEPQQEALVAALEDAVAAHTPVVHKTPDLTDAETEEEARLAALKLEQYKRELLKKEESFSTFLADQKTSITFTQAELDTIITVLDLPTDEYLSTASVEELQDTYDEISKKSKRVNDLNEQGNVSRAYSKEKTVEQPYFNFPLPYKKKQLVTDYLKQQENKIVGFLKTLYQRQVETNFEHVTQGELWGEKEFIRKNLKYGNDRDQLNKIFDVMNGQLQKIGDRQILEEDKVVFGRNAAERTTIQIQSKLNELIDPHTATANLPFLISELLARAGGRLKFFAKEEPIIPADAQLLKADVSEKCELLKKILPEVREVISVEKGQSLSSDQVAFIQSVASRIDRLFALRDQATSLLEKETPAQDAITRMNQLQKEIKNFNETVGKEESNDLRIVDIEQKLAQSARALMDKTVQELQERVTLLGRTSEIQNMVKGLIDDQNAGDISAGVLQLSVMVKETKLNLSADAQLMLPGLLRKCNFLDEILPKVVDVIPADKPLSSEQVTFVKSIARRTDQLFQLEDQAASLLEKETLTRADITRMEQLQEQMKDFNETIFTDAWFGKKAEDKNFVDVQKYFAATARVLMNETLEQFKQKVSSLREIFKTEKTWKERLTSSFKSLWKRITVGARGSESKENKAAYGLNDFNKGLTDSYVKNFEQGMNVSQKTFAEKEVKLSVLKPAVVSAKVLLREFKTVKGIAACNGLLSYNRKVEPFLRVNTLPELRQFNDNEASNKNYAKLKRLLDGTSYGVWQEKVNQLRVGHNATAADLSDLRILAEYNGAGPDFLALFDTPETGQYILDAFNKKSNVAVPSSMAKMIVKQLQNKVSAFEKQVQDAEEIVS